MKTQRLLFIGAFQLIVLSCFGQQFISHPVLPFGIHTARQDSTRKAQTIFFFDYDGDGDRDLFLTGLDYIDNVPNLKWINLHFFIEMQENIGSNESPQFGERQDVFQQFPYPVGYFFASGGDLNGDLKMDLMTMAHIDYIGNEKLRMLTNTGASGSGEFLVSTLENMGLTDFVPESFFVPHLTDLDSDGDLDILMSGFESAFGEEDGPDVPTFFYAKNVGTKNVPNFQGWYTNPYGLTPDSKSEVLTSGDIDNDGDMDLVGGLIGIPADSANYLTVHLNTPGTNSKPAFPSTLQSPFGMPTSSGATQLSFPTLADMDDDGDLDLFVFIGTSQASTLHYYENNLCQPTSASVEATICEGDSYSVGNESFSIPGSYMVLTTSANGCDSIVFLTLNVTVLDPAVTTQDITLTANQTGVSYQWVDCDSGLDIAGAVNQTFIPTVNGNYAVHLTDGSGCSAQSECIFVMVTGLEEDFTSNNITLYPNPSKGIVFIKNQTSLPITKLIVMDVSGEVKGEFLPDHKNLVDLSALRIGVYFIKIQLTGKEVIKRIVVE